MDVKQLQKLAKLCRKLGVSHLKSGDIELSLSPEIIKAPKQKPRGRTASTPVNESLFNEPDLETQQKLASQALSETDLLFWSTPQNGDM